MFNGRYKIQYDLQNKQDLKTEMEMELEKIEKGKFKLENTLWKNAHKAKVL